MPWKDPERASVEADVRREIAAHLDLATEDGVRSGLDPARARLSAEDRFGDVERIVRASRYVKRKEWIRMQRLNVTLVALLAIAVGWLAAQTIALRAESRVVARAMEALIAERSTGEAVRESVPGPLTRPPEPVDPEQIVLHVGDRVTVSDVLCHLSPVSVTDEIDRAGLLLLPDLGRVRLAGLSRPGAETLLNERYREYYEEVEIVIEVRSAYLE